MERRTFLKSVLGAAAAGFPAPNISLGAEPLTIRFAHFAKEDHPAHVAARQFADRIAERTAGEIRIDIFPDNALGSPVEQAEKLRLGTLDMGLPLHGHLDKYDRAFAAIQLPFTFRDPDDAFGFLDGPGMKWFAPLAEKQGFILLRDWDYGFRNITNGIRPIQVPEDVKGLKLRTPNQIQMQSAMEALGAEVIIMDFPQVYQALSSKTVDGEENPVAVVYANKFYEVQKYLAITRHIYDDMIHAMSVSSWRNLSSAQQSIFQEESAAAGKLMRQLIAEREAREISKLKSLGMEVTEPDNSLFYEKMDPAYKRIAAYIGQANVKTFFRLRLLNL